MRASISNGNTKIGKTMNVSLTPVESCIPNAPCAKNCYARKSYRRFKGCREAWDSNLALFKTNASVYFAEIRAEISKKKPEYFRWHVGGDIPSQTRYLRGIILTAKVFPDTKFLVFTKRYRLLRELDLRCMPANLKIVASMWPGLYVPASVLRRFPLAFYRNDKTPDDRIPSDTFTCPGECETCRYCWSMTKKKPVVFDHH